MNKESSYKLLDAYDEADGNFIDGVNGSGRVVGANHRRVEGGGGARKACGEYSPSSSFRNFDGDVAT